MTPKNRNVRRCLYCETTQVVVRSNRLDKREFCVLECGHQCAYLLEGDDMALQSKGIDLDCVVCDHHYTTFCDDEFGRFCIGCRSALRISTQREGKEVLELVLKLDKDKRKEFVEEYRKTARVPASTALVSASAPAPKIDQAKVREAMRMMIEYGRRIDEITSDRPLAQPTTYVIAENGLFEVHSTDIGQIVTPATAVKGLEGKLAAGLNLNIPKVPYEILRQTVAFFRETCAKQKGSSEAYLQIWWNTVKEEYKVFVPEQRVSGASVNHEGGFPEGDDRTEEGAAIWLHVMDIHSHGSGMSAFWSGTDDADEKKAPAGRLFGVIGNVLNPLPSWKWRVRTRDGFMDLKVPDIFAVDVETNVPFNVSWRTLLQAAAEKDGVTEQGGIRLVCSVDPFKTATCPEEWHTKVNGRSSHQSSGGSSEAWWNRSGRAHSGVMPLYIYIKNQTELVEYEVLEHGGTKATGKRLSLTGQKEEGLVH